MKARVVLALALRAGLMVLGLVAATLMLSGPASAYTNTRLMDDAVFDDVDSMTEQQIRNFINARPNTCLTRVGAGLGGGAIYPEPITYWQYGGNVDAARVIYRAAVYNDLNPQVILATLQKEQSLLTDSDCLDQNNINRLPKAMGQGCFEGQPCPTAAYAGFHQQVMKGAWQLKFNKERANGNVEWGDNGSIVYGGPWTEGMRKGCSTCNNIYRDGYWTIDGQAIKMETGATAALYRYTPHLGQAFPSIFETYFGWTWAGPQCEEEDGYTNVYRFWSPRFNNVHFYTANPEERSRLMRDKNWTSEGVSFCALTGPATGYLPAYRFWSPKYNNAHFFTTNEDERARLKNSASWIEEGVTFYVPAEATTDSEAKPVHRFWSPRFSNDHFFTGSEWEKTRLMTDRNWVYEGIAWYARLPEE